MNIKTAASLVVLATFTGLAALPASADITAANVHQDRAQFLACQDAFDSRNDSNDAFAHAVGVCGVASLYYAKEVEKAKNNDTACPAALYATASMWQLAYIARESANPENAEKVENDGTKIIKWVIADCTDEPNIETMAKGFLSVHKALAKIST